MTRKKEFFHCNRRLGVVTYDCSQHKYDPEWPFDNQTGLDKEAYSDS